MPDGTKFVIALVMFLLAMVAFFFAFHPGGVEGVSDPQSMLSWLNGEFNDTVSGTTPPTNSIFGSSADTASTSPPIANPATSGNQSATGNPPTTGGSYNPYINVPPASGTPSSGNSPYLNG